MAGARSPYPTLYEVLKSVQPGRNWRKSVVDDIKPKPFKPREGLVELSPEQLLTIRVPEQKIHDGHVEGYQRHLDSYKARRASERIANDAAYMKTLGTPEVSLTDDMLFFTDGQHRAAGAVIARVPLRVLITKRSEAEARQLFTDQRYATKPPANVQIFNASGVFEEYIQDAVTDPSHPWNRLISTAQKSAGPSKITAAGALGMLRIFVGRSTHQGNFAGTPDTQADFDARFDKHAADQLATLLSAFGSKQTNPLAYKASSLRAIAIAAKAVFRDRDPDYRYLKEDEQRWITHMTRFPFHAFASLGSASELALRMKLHWNKNLTEDSGRRVDL